MPSRSMLLGLGAGLLAALIWGGGAVVSRYLVLDRMDAIDLTFLRYAGCFPIALAVAFAAPQHARLGTLWWQTAILLLLAGPAYHLLLIYGYNFATAGAGALLVSGLLPIFAIAISTVLTARAPGIRAVAGTLLVALGLLIFANPKGGALSATGPATVEPAGIAVFVSAAFLWAVLNELIRRWRVSPLRLTVTLALWSPLFLPLYILLRPAEGLSAPWGELALQIVYHGVLVAFVGTLLFFYAVRLLGTEIAALLQASIPAVAAILGVLVLGEWITANQSVAIVLTVTGIMLASLSYGAGGSRRAGDPSRSASSSISDHPSPTRPRQETDR